jgi:hypothetical protein
VKGWCTRPGKVMLLPMHMTDPHATLMCFWLAHASFPEHWQLDVKALPWLCSDVISSGYPLSPHVPSPQQTVSCNNPAIGKCPGMLVAESKDPCTCFHDQLPWFRLACGQGGTTCSLCGHPHATHVSYSMVQKFLTTPSTIHAAT